MACLVALLLAAPVLDSFDAPLDPQRWYIGVPKPPSRGVLRIPRDGWIVSRAIPDDTIEGLEITFRHRGGTLELTFHDARQPLSSPRDPLLVARGSGERILNVAAGGADLDGSKLEWKGRLSGTFRLRALKGDVELLEVRVAPRIGDPPPLGVLEKNTVLLPTTPLLFSRDRTTWRRKTLMLWDAEVALLLKEGGNEFEPLAAPPRGSPVLGVLVSIDGGPLALAASSNSLAMRDWGDERRNMNSADFLKYITAEYGAFAAIMAGQRALNAALPGRKGLEPLVHLAVIRHSPNARAAVALAQTERAKGALAALQRALGKGKDVRRAAPDEIRKAAGVAARAILGEPPPEWPGFSFDPSNRFLTMQQAKDLAR